MRVRASLKKVCSGCQIVKRGRNVYVICSQNARHKTKQKFSTMAFGSLPAEATMAPAVPMTLSAPLVASAGMLTSMGLPFWARVGPAARGSAAIDGPHTGDADEDVL